MYGYKNSTRLMHEEIDAARYVLVWQAEPGSCISNDILMSFPFPSPVVSVTTRSSKAQKPAAEPEKAKCRNHSIHSQIAKYEIETDKPNAKKCTSSDMFLVLDVRLASKAEAKHCRLGNEFRKQWQQGKENANGFCKGTDPTTLESVVNSSSHSNIATC